jgi:hypothetical protein
MADLFREQTMVSTAHGSESFPNGNNTLFYPGWREMASKKSRRAKKKPPCDGMLHRFWDQSLRRSKARPPESPLANPKIVLQIVL